MEPKITVVNELPEVGAVENPAMLYDGSSLWMACEASQAVGGGNTVVKFTHVIDHRLSPINDEGLGKHKYARFGLEFYSFQEVLHSCETQEWKALRARHWIVTFKDVTLDVVAEEVSSVGLDATDCGVTSTLCKLAELTTR